MHVVWTSQLKTQASERQGFWELKLLTVYLQMNLMSDTPIGEGVYSFRAILGNLKVFLQRWMANIA